MAQQDCFDAIYVCSESYQQTNSFNGVGNAQEIPTGSTCLGNGEVNSVWYTFTANAGGELLFQLNPLNPNDDYDFALFNLTNDSCSGIAAGLNQPVSCNYSAAAGATGLSTGGSGNDNGSSGSNQNAPVSVQQGETYALLVSNFTASQNGYSLDFSGTASIADNVAPMPDSVSLMNRCNPLQVLLLFDEPFQCPSVSGDNSEITVTGPEGVNINNLTPAGCTGGNTDRLRIRFTDRIMTTGTYTVTIGNGSDGDSFTDNCGNATPAGTTITFVVNNIGPEVSITNVVNASCGQTNGEAEAIPTSGTPPYSFNWNSSPSQNTAVATELEPGQYRVAVIDDNGCREFATVNIQNDSPFDLSDRTSTSVTCPNDADGTATINPQGGSGPYDIAWQTSPAQNGNTATGLPGGNVQVVVTDATGCEETTTINIPEPNAILTPTTSTNPDCGVANGSATVNATGGNAGFSYAWNTSPPQSTATASGLMAGVYDVNVTDQNGCTANASVVLTDNFAPDAFIGNTTPDCGQGVGEATVEVNNGTPPYSYAWNTTPAQITQTATGLGEGDYFVTITDANGCVQIINVKIDSVPPPELSLDLVQPDCGASNGSATATTSGGTEPFTYLWGPGAGTDTMLDSITEGSYTLVVTDAIGCTDSESFDLEQLSPDSDFEFENVCIGEEMSFTPTSTSGATSWVWQFGDRLSSDAENPTHTYAEPGSYDVTVIFSGGCMNDTVVQTVNVYDLPPTDFVVEPEAVTTRVPAEPMYLGNNATDFVWDMGDGTILIENAPEHQYETEGFYDISMTVTDENGCTDSSTQTIEVLLHPGIYFPNAFIPGGLPENSVFKGYGVGIVAAELFIFNRKGDRLYRSTDVSEILNLGWDGTYNGNPVPQGVYVYRIKAEFYNNTSFERLGTVTLLR